MLTNLTFTIGTALLLAIGVGLQRSGAITVGTLLVLFQYAQLIRQPLERIIDQLKQLQAAQAGVARAEELFAEQSSLAWRDDGRVAPARSGRSTSTSATCRSRTATRPCCTTSTSDWMPDARLGLVGRTGGGKSTITRMLLRLYDPSDGDVRVGGVDLRDGRAA